MATVEQIIEQVRALQQHELDEVGKAVNEILAERAESDGPQMTEDEFERYLAAKGVITLPEPMSDEELAREIADEEAWEPIEVQGTPLSQMIIEERR